MFVCMGNVFGFIVQHLCRLIRTVKIPNHTFKNQEQHLFENIYVRTKRQVFEQNIFGARHLRCIKVKVLSLYSYIDFQIINIYN